MDPNSIWPPNLSQLLPDLAVALVTGIVVGLALDIVQRRAIRRAARSEAKRGWNRLQPRLRPFFSRPVHFTSLLNTGWDEAGFAQLLEDEPIRDWADLINDAEIEQVIRLDNNVGRWRSLVVHLLGELDGATRDSAPDPRPTQTQLDAWLSPVRHGLDQTLGLAEFPMQYFEQNEASLGLSPADAAKWIVRAKAEPSIARVAPSFERALREIKSDHDVLRAHFERADGLLL